MDILLELKNQARSSRRPAVYGKRRQTNANTKELHRQLFGTDENEIESGLRNLSINTEFSRKVKPERKTRSESREEAIPCSETKDPKSPTSPLKRKRQPVIAADTGVDAVAVSNSHDAHAEETVPPRNPSPEPVTRREARKAPGRSRRKRKIPVSTLSRCPLQEYRANVDRSCQKQKNSVLTTCCLSLNQEEQSSTSRSTSPRRQPHVM
jgi:hypothetical protein